MTSQSNSSSSLSTRISLRWLPDPAFENTDTIVLSLLGWYVDLRVDKSTGEIDWAIAGQRIVESQEPLRVLFTHAIDSHNAFEAVDCGTFTPLPNGDDLEIGSMPRWDLPGKPVREYEEVWRELPFREGPEGPGRGVSWRGRSGRDGSTVTRMFIGRIWGTYVALRQEQMHYSGDSKAVVKDGREASARREEWDSATGWQAKYVLGPDVDKLPSMTTIGTGDGDWSIGREVVLSGQAYIVRAFERIEQE
ncbi:uncharacterized protein P174DRAFT_445145 [Aspergillus novofumigatus IBT 16806]|uniref:Protein HRI1 n=1 Tax=Aspergillus novofumigatus (strain IBT 16806) TaxID=1392255 RepID=A0A2I1BXV3_ASPN1|nr:uncharacterized protein P174DRAFT_445145 [Aspergillus novofumigatus IBT 16806]PKX90208.1 hypothetical protein P174DRAFT_445145 [Aspergillus novofumigatus IBT 16806]